MHSVRQAASIFYYLGKKEGESSEAALFTDKGSAGGKPNYYDSRGKDDVFKTRPIWVGALAQSLNMPAGSEVSVSQLAAMWFGIDPRDGVTPLTQGGPSIAEQVRAQKLIATAEAALHNAHVNLARVRADLANSGVPIGELADDPRTAAAQAAADKAKEALKAAKADPGHRQDAHDCTFSAPKGVSVYWARLKTDGAAGNEAAARRALEIEAAMVDSVRQVIEKYVEPELLFTRSRLGGHKDVDYEHVKGIASALFLHFEARPTVETIDDPAAPGGRREVQKNPDPQLHVHSLLMSMGLDHNDEVKALWSTFLGSHSKAIGAAFRGELAHRLRAMGLDIKVDAQDKVQGFDLSGIEDGVAGAFSSRADQVEANIADGMRHQDAKLSGRETKGDIDGAGLLADWGQRLDAMGVNAEKIALATNMSIARAQAEQAMEDLVDAGVIQAERDSPEWSRLLDREFKSALSKLETGAPTVEEAVEQLLSMETAFTMTDIAKLSFEASQFCHKELEPGQSPMQWAEAFRARILRHPELRQIHGKDKYGRPSFTSRGLIRREKELYYTLLPQLLARRSDGMPPEAVEKGIAEFERTESERRGTPFELRDFQKQMVRDMGLNHGSIHIALAPAGCGKTTAVLGAVIGWEAEGCRILSLAPSNKAAQGLAQDLRKERKDGMSPQKLLGKIRRKEIELTSKDVLLCDEASMLDFDTADALVRAALEAKGGPARIVFIGDTEQLPAVGRGNFFRTLAESEQFDSKAELGARNMSNVASSAAHWNRINRQREDLGKQATAFFALGENARALEIYERMGALKLATTREEAMDALAHDAFLPLSGLADDFMAAREERESRYRAFSKEASGAMKAAGKGRASMSAIEPDALSAVLGPARQAELAQWLEDKAALDKARAALIKGYSGTLMLATKNADVDALNSKAREILKSIGALGGVDGKRKFSIPRGKVGSFEICEGERLMFDEAADGSSVDFSKKGDMAAKTTVGTVLGISKDKRGDVILIMEIDGQPGQRARVNTRRFSKFSYAYAMTAHASQGATCSRVYEYASDFAAKQTDYVAKSRYRDAHAIYAAETQYALYKKRASEAIEKSDAKDLAFASTVFGLDEIQLGELDRQIDEGRAATAGFASALEASRQRSIAQGTLVAHGAAPLGFKEGMKESCYATLLVDGREITLWGGGLAKALSDLGAEPGAHIGLEPLSGKRADGETMQWRGYTAERLDKAGLLMDEAGLSKRASSLMESRARKDKASRDAFQETIASSFMAQKEAEALVQATLARATTLAARVASERGVLDELGRKAELPQDIDERLDRALEALPYAKRGAGAQIRELLSAGIVVQPWERPMIGRGREWLATDGELAFCATEWGTVEAWSSKSLPAQALAEAAAVGGSIEKIAKRRLGAIEQARAAGLEPVKAAMGALGAKLSVSMIEHPKHGLCVGLAAAVTGAHKSDPDLRRLFVGEGDYGQDASLKKNGIGGLRHCKGFDPQTGAWLFSLRCDELGAPLPEQAAIAELAELGARLGHSVAATGAWDARKGQAWEAIESRLGAPWGLAFARACAAIGIQTEAPDLLAKRVLMGKAHDIVRWDERVLSGSDEAQHWQMCSATGADGLALPEIARRLSGVVLHADERDLYILRDQKIIAVERADLGADGPGDAWIGRRVDIRFEEGARPALQSESTDAMIEKGRAMGARIAAGEAVELSRMPGWLSAAYQRASAGAELAPEDQGYALAWAHVEGKDLSALGSRRSEGMSPIPPGSLPLEAFAGKRMDMKDVRVCEVGPQGALIEAGGRHWLLDKEQARQALGKSLRGGGQIHSLKLRRDALGRAHIDVAATHKAREAQRARA